MKTLVLLFTSKSIRNLSFVPIANELYPPKSSVEMAVAFVAKDEAIVRGVQMTNSNAFGRG